jgi:hypothetical protein
MSNTSPEPCTKLRSAVLALYAPMIRHWSYALTSRFGSVGRSGPTICGLSEAVDQERALHLARRKNIYGNVKIDEMRSCQRCETFVSR